MARRLIEPMMAARTTVGEDPTSITNKAIRPIVRSEDIFLPRNRVILAVKATRIVIFMPERAIIWIVPVSIRAW